MKEVMIRSFLNVKVNLMQNRIATAIRYEQDLFYWNDSRENRSDAYTLLSGLLSASNRSQDSDEATPLLSTLEKS